MMFLPIGNRPFDDVAMLILSLLSMVTMVNEERVKESLVDSILDWLFSRTQATREMIQDSIFNDTMHGEAMYTGI